MNHKELTAEYAKDPKFLKARKDNRFRFRLARAVLHARTAKGWSQTELARRVETKQANISNIESFNTNPTLDFVRRICDVLDIEMEFDGPSGIKIPIEALSIPTVSSFDCSDLIRVDNQIGNVFTNNKFTKTFSSGEIK